MTKTACCSQMFISVHSEGCQWKSFEAVSDALSLLAFASMDSLRVATFLTRKNPFLLGRLRAIKLHQTGSGNAGWKEKKAIRQSEPTSHGI